MFYAMNQEGKPAARARGSKWLFQKTATQKLAYRFVTQSPHLGTENVDIIRDRL